MEPSHDPVEEGLGNEEILRSGSSIWRGIGDRLGRELRAAHCSPEQLLSEIANLLLDVPSDELASCDRIVFGKLLDNSNGALVQGLAHHLRESGLEGELKSVNREDECTYRREAPDFSNVCRAIAMVLCDGKELTFEAIKEALKNS